MLAEYHEEINDGKVGKDFLIVGHYILQKQIRTLAQFSMHLK